MDVQVVNGLHEDFIDEILVLLI